MDVIERAGTVYDDGTIERCVGFVFSKRMPDWESFELQVRQAMQEYLERPAGQDANGSEFVASNGVTVSLAVFDAVGAMAEQTDPIVGELTEEEIAQHIVFPSQGFGPEELEIAEAEARHIASAQRNPRKTA